MLWNRSRRNIFKIGGASLASAGIALSSLFRPDKAHATHKVDLRLPAGIGIDLPQKNRYAHSESCFFVSSCSLSQ